MLPEISLNILDIAQNSIVANASLVKIIVEINTADNLMRVTIADDGCGMTPEQVAAVEDPFYTSRKTRKVGLGIPFFKQEAELTGGFLTVESEVNVGTTITAEFHTDSIDCMPLGNMRDTIHSLVTMNEQLDFHYVYSVDEKSFELLTAEMREILGGVSFKQKEVSEFIRGYLEENESEVNRKDAI